MSPLDDLLAKRGCSMRAVARMGGPPAYTLRMWRKGSVIPRRSTIEKLARVLGLEFALVARVVAETVALARQERGSDG